MVKVFLDFVSLQEMVLRHPVLLCITRLFPLLQSSWSVTLLICPLYLCVFSILQEPAGFNMYAAEVDEVKVTEKLSEKELSWIATDC